MADKKISDLNAITGANTADGDLFVIVDTSANETKSITKAELFNQDITIGGNLTVQGTTITIDSASAQTVDLGDNDKIRLGDGDDLQIYHNGSNSYILEQGTGRLFINTDGAGVSFLKTNGESLLTLDTDGAVTAYYDNSAKLATTNTGIDVTGTVTADGLTVDGAVNVNGTVGDIVKIATTAGNADLWLTDTDTSAGQVRVRGDANSLKFITDTKVRHTIASNGDINFYDTAGSTAGFHWDAAAESLGIGTTSPAQILHIKGDNTTEGYQSPGLTIEQDGTGDATINFLLSGTQRYLLGVDNSDSDKFKIFSDNDGDFSGSGITLDTTGNVGIGTSSPEAPLHVKGDLNYVSALNGNGTITVSSDDLGNNGYDGAPSIVFEAPYDSGALSTIRIPYGIIEGRKETTSSGDTAGFLAFSTSASGGSGTSERMRIDSSGNLLVGKTSSGIDSAGFQVFPGTDSYSAFTNTRTDGNGFTAYFNRQGSDGGLISFRKANSSVGSIGTKNLDLYIGTGDTGLKFRDGVDDIIPFNTSTIADGGAISLGDGTNRFKDLYLSGGVYLGGTGAANHLDDYEEGTWTPQFNDDGGGGDFTSSGVTAKYTKVGRVVHIHIWVNGTTNSGAVSISGNLKLDDLPFTVDSAVIDASIIRARNVSSGEVFRAEVPQSGTSIVFYKDSTETRAATSDILYANNGTNDRLVVSLSYLTT